MAATYTDHNCFVRVVAMNANHLNIATTTATKTTNCGRGIQTRNVLMQRSTH